MTYKTADSEPPREVTIAVGEPLYDGEKRIILATLEYCRGDKSKAARVLGVNRNTITNKLRSYGVVK